MNEEILQLAKKLISIPSETKDLNALKKIISVCKKELNEFTIEEFEKNNYPSLLVYKERKRPPQFKVILNAHLDVVPADPSQYKITEKGGRLYGRGSMDMKAACAAQIVLFKKIAGALSFPIALQLVTDEETGGFNGTKHQISEGVRSEFVIAGEPTDMGINTQSKGILWIKVTFSGQSAHAAYPWNGENAIKKASDFISEVSKLYRVPKKEEWKTTVNFSLVSTNNNATNKVPENCELTLDIRYIPGEKEKIIKTVQRLAGKEAKVEILVDESVHFTKENNPFVTQMSKALEQNNIKAQTIVKHGGSDVRFYNEIGTPGITIGPIGQGLHSDDEWVDIKSLNKFAKTIENFLHSL